MPKRTRLSDVFGALLLPAFLIPVLGVHTPVRVQKEPRITGTYTNMSYIEEAGDVIGYEIKIVFTGSKFQGALQIAEGVPGELMLVDIKVVGTNISFTIPDGSPYPGQFSGTIENGLLKGTFSFKNGGGGSETVELRRGRSYWDQA